MKLTVSGFSIFTVFRFIGTSRIIYHLFLDTNLTGRWQLPFYYFFS